MNIQIVRRALLLAALGLLAGCAGTVTNMREMPVSEAPTAPAPGKAMIVFMRPSGLGFAIQSTVYTVRNDSPELIGILAAKTRVAYQAEPGKHLFMTIGENADYMTADVAAGKIYYVKVEPRMGMWKARFGLEPYRLKDLSAKPFTDDLAECKPVEKTAASDAWFRENAASVNQKHKEYYGDWMKTEEAKRPNLAAADGR